MYEDYTEEEVIKLTKENPERFYEDPNGQIIYEGMKFKNKEEFEKYIDTLANPPKFLKLLYKILSFIFRKK